MPVSADKRNLLLPSNFFIFFFCDKDLVRLK